MLRQPERLDLEELLEGCRESARLFVQGYLAEQSAPYRRHFPIKRAAVQRLFAATDNLRHLSPAALLAPSGARQGAERLRLDRELVEAARYLAAPMISDDHLDALTKLNLETFQPYPQSLTTEQSAFQIMQIISMSLDPFRFPWLAAGRDPTDAELVAAVDWTASSIASERVRTERRTSAGAAQEALVAAALANAGWQQRPRAHLRFPDDLPVRSFMKETKLGDVKCDVPARLLDRRLLAIECKASNTAVNSVKRINDTTNKAAEWQRVFGQQVITTLVISGVVDGRNLLRAQDQSGVFVVFEHDLRRLADFLREAVP